MNNKKFGVYKEVEVYKKISGYNRYHYECLTDSTLIKVFDNKEDAIKYCNDYKLSCELSSGAMYADCIGVYEVNNDNDKYDHYSYEIVSDNLYNKAYSYEELESILDIKLVIY